MDNAIRCFTLRLWVGYFIYFEVTPLFLLMDVFDGFFLVQFIELEYGGIVLNAHMRSTKYWSHVFEGAFTSCKAKSQPLYLQLVRNSVKEEKEMENDFLNTTKLNVNLNNYTNINLFYNYEIKYSISFTGSQQEIMFDTVTLASYRSTWNCSTVPLYFEAFNQIWERTNGWPIYF